MRASLLALLLLAACSGGEGEGGLSGDEAERLENASGMLDEDEARFEDREVDEGAPNEDAGAEGAEAAD